MEVISVELFYYFGEDKRETEELLTYYLDKDNDNQLTLDTEGHSVMIKGKDPLDVMSDHAEEFANMTQPNTFTLAIKKLFCGEEFLHSVSYTVGDIIQMRKTAERLDTVCRKGCSGGGDDDSCNHDDSWDWGSMFVYRWFIHEIVRPMLKKLCDVNEIRTKLRILKGLDCPVLRVPLDKNALILKKCKHFISQEAWCKIQTYIVADNNMRKCPLCRCEYTLCYGEVSSKLEDILELLPELEAEAEPKPVDTTVKAFPKPERIPLD